MKLSKQLPEGTEIAQNEKLGGLGTNFEKNSLIFFFLHVSK